MSTPSHRTAPDPNITGYPPGIAYIIGNEGCERFSYYGMRAILYVYVVALYMELRGMDAVAADKGATATFHLFGAAVYALPIIGAVVADRLLGKYRTILWLSLVYCLGHLALAVFENPTWQREVFGQVFVDPVQGLYIGLGLIAVGSGGIKPCVSAHVGDQFGRGNWHKLEQDLQRLLFHHQLRLGLRHHHHPAHPGRARRRPRHRHPPLRRQRELGLRRPRHPHGPRHLLVLARPQESSSTSPPTPAAGLGLLDVARRQRPVHGPVRLPVSSSAT
jgi:hypothetical protein